MNTAIELLSALKSLPIEVVEIEESERGEGFIRIALRIPEEDVETCSIALLFAFGVISYDEARPAGSSEIDYDPGDQWTVHDLVKHLRFHQGRLNLDTDYVRGRLMKTRAVVAAYRGGISGRSPHAA